MLFNQAAENAAATASLAHEMFTRLPDVETMAEKALELEERGDQLTRTIRHALDTAVVTPFDREDIHALAESIDTAVDHMTGAVDLCGSTTSPSRWRASPVMWSTAVSMLSARAWMSSRSKGVTTAVSRACLMVRVSWSPRSSSSSAFSAMVSTSGSLVNISWARLAVAAAFSAAWLNSEETLVAGMSRKRTARTLGGPDPRATPAVRPTFAGRSPPGR